MTVRLHKLAVTGPGKKPALLNFNGESHLIFGPTDTGKSYIVECLRYCLGSSQRPKDIGCSEGYTRVALQVSAVNETNYTIFRDMTEGNGFAYLGFHVYPPQGEISPLSEEVSQLIVSLSNGYDRKILTKSGTLGNFTAGDLRRVSLFDEIETLDNVSLVGKDTNLKVRNRSALALILTGTDDSEIVLPPSTTKRNIAKGHVEALTEEVAGLRADIPGGMSKSEIQETLALVSSEIERINSYLQIHAKDLESIKKERARIDKKNQGLSQRRSALNEAESRFLLLDNKYESDLQRLQAIGTAASIVTNFETRPCPLCLTDIAHQARHTNEDDNMIDLRQAAQAECEKILGLRGGLQQALSDVLEELEEVRQQLDLGIEAMQLIIKRQESLLSPTVPRLENGLSALAERKSILLIAIRDLERVERLEARLNEMKTKAKRQKQKIERDISQSATLLCDRIKELLENWAVPDVRSVYYDEPEADIKINQRKRISYGKGKRGIFLTAYVVALMERAVTNKLPHLGFIAVDSPVVTYKDPKHSSEDSEELLPVAVKDQFYAWLSDRKEEGQIIVLENEEPDEQLKSKLHLTEFVGLGMLKGRVGFFPS